MRYRCACGGTFTGTVALYRDHLKTTAHQAWRVLEGIEDPVDEALLTRPAMFECRCGEIHWTDSRVGRAHWSLGSEGTEPIKDGISRGRLRGHVERLVDVAVTDHPPTDEPIPLRPADADTPVVRTLRIHQLGDADGALSVGKGHV